MTVVVISVGDPCSRIMWRCWRFVLENVMEMFVRGVLHRVSTWLDLFKHPLDAIVLLTETVSWCISVWALVSGHPVPVSYEIWLFSLCACPSLVSSCHVQPQHWLLLRCASLPARPLLPCCAIPALPQPLPFGLSLGFTECLNDSCLIVRVWLISAIVIMIRVKLGLLLLNLGELLQLGIL